MLYVLTLMTLLVSPEYKWVTKCLFPSEMNVKCTLTDQFNFSDHDKF